MTSEAALAEVLRPLLSQSGGVEDPGKFEKFRELLQKETALKGRFLLVTILELTKAEECLKQLVDNEGLNTLNAWLLEARDAGVAKANEGGGGAEGSSSIWTFASKIIEVLKKLPVTVDALTKAEVGKTVRSLTKLAQAGEVRQASKGLITQWKTRFVKQHDPASDGKKAAAGKRHAAGQPDGAPNGKKAPPAALKPVSDDSLFTSKPSKPPPPREARPYAPQRRKVQRLEDVPGAEKPEAPGPGGDQQPGGAQGGDAAPKQPSTTPVGTGATAAATATAPTTTAVERPKLIKISTTPRLGQFAHLTVLKPPTAAERAEAAAARVERELADLPAPPPRDPNKTRKAVSWRDDESLAAIRTFDKEQPPSSVCEDVEQQQQHPQDTLLPSPSSELQHRLGFLSAAKREHSNECRNIAALHEGDGGDGPGGEGQSPKPWSRPLQIVFRAEPQCASGESSVFYGEEVSRTQNVAEFTAVTSNPKSSFAHYSPFEPPPMSEEQKQAVADWVPPEVPWDVVQYAPPQQEQQQGGQYAAPQQQEQGYIAPPPPNASYGQPQQQYLQQQHYQQHYQQQQQQQQPQQYQQHGYPPPPGAPPQHQYQQHHQQQYPLPQQPPFSAPPPPAAPAPPPRPPSNGSQNNNAISNLVSQLDPSLVSKLLTRGL